MVSDYLNHWNEILKQTEDNFTILADVTQMKVPPPEVGKIHEQAQKLTLDNGCSKVAELLPRSVVARLTTSRLSQKSGLDVVKKQFIDFQEAENWLDSTD